MPARIALCGRPGKRGHVWCLGERQLPYAKAPSGPLVGGLVAIVIIGRDCRQKIGISEFTISVRQGLLHLDFFPGAKRLIVRFLDHRSLIYA